MSFELSTKADQKMRWGGLLEHPYISKVQRNCLDGFKVTGLKRIIGNLDYHSILDVGCGLGEYSRVAKQSNLYVGLDNSLPRVAFANQKYRFPFLQADANVLPFKDNAFDAMLFANIAHHLTDEELTRALTEMIRVSNKYIIIDDCVSSHNQFFLSKFFYSLDRGTRFRSIEQFEELFAAIPNIHLILKDTHRTFPGLYLHAVFVLEVQQ
ncbi:MAG: class I SAM-dependent methyltransferase [Candidatus Omnitrophica bacterium]|nr:class I SAM-dependent methyltransferase [Candidatus Omnitrophota bacterium]